MVGDDPGRGRRDGRRQPPPRPAPPERCLRGGFHLRGREGGRRPSPLAVRPGQPAWLSFPVFDPKTAPEVSARLLRVSPDALVADVTGAAHYIADVRPEEEALERLRLVPGVPVDAYVLTGERTALAYLLAPLSDYFVRAFREG